MSVADAAKAADVVMMLTPDELQADIYNDHLKHNMREGAAIFFAHGLNIHFSLIEPRGRSRCGDGRAERARATRCARSTSAAQVCPA